MGYMAMDKGPDQTNADSLIVTTNEQGIAEIDSFRTSQVAGDFRVIYKLVADPAVGDTLDLTVAVPGLVNFANQPSNGRWRLTGAIAGLHTDNHWFDNDEINSIVNALNDFYDWSLSDENGGVAIRLGINDTSLPLGGSYDFEGDWNLNSRHSFHRVGLSVDIDRRFSVNQIFQELTQNQRDQLTRIMRSFGGIEFDEPTTHYGFGGAN